MALTSTGIGSGLDVNGLVQKLVQAEGAPKTARLDSAEAKAQAKLSALGTLRAALTTFRDTLAKLKDLDSFRGRQVTLSSPDFLKGTASSSAAPGSYAIEVEQLAQAQKLQSSPFLAKTTVVGTGTLTVTAGGQSFNIVIDSTNDTVAGIASAINASPAGGKVAATVITGVGGAATLTLTALNTGTANALTLTQSGGDGGLAALVFPPGVGSVLSEIAPALDAHAKIEGVEVTSTTNAISGAIDGVEVDLLKANDVGDTSTLTVQYDKAAARAQIDSLVKSYNGILDAVKSVASFNTDTKQGGPLFGDGGVRNIADQLRRVLGSAVPGLGSSFDMLAKIGVSAGLDGKLTVDGTKLDAAFTTNFDDVGKLFADPNAGIAIKLDQLLDPYLQTGGVFDGRNASLKSSIDDIGDQRKALNDRLTALQDRYLKQFNALDSLLAQLQSTSNFLTQQLANLPGSTPLTKKSS
jgi:flagellar hook-associated protein 2